MDDLQGKIDLLLAERRPDRYEHQGGDAWLDGIADDIEDLIPEVEARGIAARQLVRRREGQKTKASNKLLREIRETGQLPLDWMETVNLPLAVGKERVALRACKADDFILFATEERRRAAGDFASRNATCEAAEWIAAHMEATGTERAKDLSFGDGADAEDNDQ